MSRLTNEKTLCRKFEVTDVKIFDFVSLHARPNEVALVGPCDQGLKSTPVLVGFKALNTSVTLLENGV